MNSHFRNHSRDQECGATRGITRRHEVVRNPADANRRDGASKSAYRTRDILLPLIEHAALRSEHCRRSRFAANIAGESQVYFALAAILSYSLFIYSSA